MAFKLFASGVGSMFRASKSKYKSQTNGVGPRGLASNDWGAGERRGKRLSMPVDQGRAALSNSSDDSRQRSRREIGPRCPSPEILFFPFLLFPWNLARDRPVTCNPVPSISRVVPLQRQRNRKSVGIHWVHVP